MLQRNAALMHLKSSRSSLTASLLLSQKHLNVTWLILTERSTLCPRDWLLVNSFTFSASVLTFLARSLCISLPVVSSLSLALRLMSSTSTTLMMMVSSTSSTHLNLLSVKQSNQVDFTSFSVIPWSLIQFSLHSEHEWLVLTNFLGFDSLLLFLASQVSYSFHLDWWSSSKWRDTYPKSLVDICAWKNLCSFVFNWNIFMILGYTLDQIAFHPNKTLQSLFTLSSNELKPPIILVRCCFPTRQSIFDFIPKCWELVVCLQDFNWSLPISHLNICSFFSWVLFDHEYSTHFLCSWQDEMIACRFHWEILVVEEYYTKFSIKTSKAR